MPGSRVSRFLLLLLLSGVLCCAQWAPAAKAASVPFTAPFSCYADQQDLGTVLVSFARAQGYSASISPGVTGKLSGRFDNVPPSQFLAGMQSAFDVAWYTLGGTIYFYNTKEVSRIFISPRSMATSDMDRVLRQSAVFSPQLPPKIGPGGKMLVVSGPPAYLAQVTSAVAAYEEAQATQLVMKVFPLKYAWAEDMTVSSMDKTVTIPGVASILRAMLTGEPVTGSKIMQEKATVEKLGGTGLAAQGREIPVAPVPIPPPTQPAAPPQGVNVMADPRVNAVLVNDAAYRMPYYEKVIADLDKPVELVEIHAAIVDIDSNFKRDLGISYQGAYNKSGGWGGGGELAREPSTFPTNPTAGAITAAGLTLSTIYTHGSDFFLSRIQALETDGEARVLGRPSVLTVDNVQATLENTTTYYVEVQGYQAVDLYKVEAGTVLRVTPHIIHHENGKTSIKLAVSVQDDQDTSSDVKSNTGVPPIKQTKINTQAIVNAGQSLLIGGYSYEQKSTDASGIPVLMRIPVLGHLFKTTGKTTKRMERLILLTPRVIRLDDLPAPPARVEEPSFMLSPTQADYTPQPRPQNSGAGCSRRVSSQPEERTAQ